MADAMQGQKQELAPSTPDIRVRRPQQRSAVSSSSLSESACVQPPPASNAGHLPGQLLPLPEPGAGAADTPYRLQPRQRERGELMKGRIRGDGYGASGVCLGCTAWQQRYAALQRRHDDEAAESAPARRAAVSALTSQLVEARGEAASLAAELTQTQRACAALRRQLSAQAADPPTQPLRAVIPLDDYLDLTEATLLCAEQLRAMSLASSEPASPGSQVLFPVRHQHAAPLGDSEEAVVPHPVQLASSIRKPAGMHDRQDASKADSEAASVAGSEGSCSSWRVYGGAASVDSMLQALEAALQSPGTPSNGLVPLICLMSCSAGLYILPIWLPAMSLQSSSACLRWCLQLHALCAHVDNLVVSAA